MLDRARWGTTKSFVPDIRALGDGRATAVEGTASGRGTIVVGFILTPEGQAAVDAAVTETARRGARLVVVHSARGGSHTDSDTVVKYREEFARLEERLRTEGIEHDMHELILGREPAEDLVETSKRTGAELIVIGLRRRSPIGKLILGSNAQEILLFADCPVLAVKAPAGS